MFVDELTFRAAAGAGGDGVVRWLSLKYQPKAGPAGGNGGRGGDVYLEGVRDINRLAKYTGHAEFAAEPGEDGSNRNQHGHNGADITIKIPVGSVVTDIARNREYWVDAAGETIKILAGGRGGLGNAAFKSSTNTAPQEATRGTAGETGEFRVEVKLRVDVGLVGLPNAGKSTLLAELTNATPKVGAYPFTTLSPHLGDLDGCIMADIPGLIEGAARGRGLGHTFLRHVERTRMLLHCLSLESSDLEADYAVVQNELAAYSSALVAKPQWIVLTKADVASAAAARAAEAALSKQRPDARIFIVSALAETGLRELRTALVSHVRST